MFTKLFNSSVKLNIILIISFSISVNSFTLFPNVNNAFYVLFHLTFIYLIFYHYHYYLYVVALVYGVLFDILLLNYVGTHLITFLSLLIFFVLLKKYFDLISQFSSKVSPSSAGSPILLNSFRFKTSNSLNRLKCFI